MLDFGWQVPCISISVIKARRLGTLRAMMWSVVANAHMLARAQCLTEASFKGAG
jgi:hypothetical protein